MSSINRQNKQIIYKQNKIEIAMYIDYKLPFFSKIVYEDENLKYARPLSFISMLANVCDEELTKEMIVEEMKKDSNTIRDIYFEGMNKKDINYALSYHAREDKLDQILKIVENNHFYNDTIENYIENKLTEPLKKLLYEKLVYLYYKHLNSAYNGICIEQFATDKNYIASGSTRSVYRLGEEFVLKVHDSNCGKDQSINEFRVISKLGEDIDYLSIPIYISRDYSVYRYYDPLNRDSENTQDIIEVEVMNKYSIDEKCLESVTRVTNKLQDYSLGLDVLGIRNIGMRTNGKLIILDYGASTSIIEYGYEDAEIQVDEIIQICTKIEDLINKNL